MKEFKLLPPDGIFTDGDEKQLGQLFSLPIVTRFLRTRLYNNIIDHANLPIADLCTEEGKLRAAYFKGSISILRDLLEMAVISEAQQQATLELNQNQEN